MENSIKLTTREYVGAYGIGSENYYYGHVQTIGFQGRQLCYVIAGNKNTKFILVPGFKASEPYFLKDIKKFAIQVEPVSSKESRVEARKALGAFFKGRIHFWQ